MAKESDNKMVRAINRVLFKVCGFVAQLVGLLSPNQEGEGLLVRVPPRAFAFFAGRAASAQRTVCQGPNGVCGRDGRGRG